jgi:hypothetical protein
MTDEGWLWKRRVCLWELCKENLEGGFFFGNPKEFVK